MAGATMDFRLSWTTEPASQNMVGLLGLESSVRKRVAFWSVATMLRCVDQSSLSLWLSASSDYVAHRVSAAIAASPLSVWKLRLGSEVGVFQGIVVVIVKFLRTICITDVAPAFGE